MDKFLQTVTDINSAVNSWVWGPVMLVFLVGVGVYLTFGLKFLHVGKIGFWMKNTFGTLFKKKGSKQTTNLYLPSRHFVLLSAVLWVWVM